MLRLIIILSTALCFTVRSTEGNLVCSRQVLPTNTYIYPDLPLYNVSQTVSYKCRRRYYLFGQNTQTCLPNGQWSGDTPYCAKESEQVRLKENEVEYGKLLDKKKRTCIATSYISLRKSIYLQISGVHREGVVEIFPDLTFRPKKQIYGVYYYSNYSGIHNYEDVRNYIKCLQDTRRLIFNCNFQEPLQNPIIRIKVKGGSEECVRCEICELTVYLNKEEISQECLSPRIEHAYWDTSYNSSYPIGTTLDVKCENGYESLSNITSVTCLNNGQWTYLTCSEEILKQCLSPQIEHAYWNKSHNSSYPIGTTLDVKCENGNKSSSNITSVTCQNDGQWTYLICAVWIEDNSASQQNYSKNTEDTSSNSSNMMLIYVLPAGIFIIVLGVIVVIVIILKKKRKKELKPEKQTDCQIELENHYELEPDVMCSVLPQTTNRKNHEIQPVYINEIFPEFICKSSLPEEEGYLVPSNIKGKTFSTDEREEVGHHYVDMNIYCSIPEVAPNGNLYANM